jgi:hypothetical protein
MSHEQAKVAMELGKTNNDFSLLVGGAGTGKTHLISYFLFYYCNKYSIKQFSNLIEYTKDGVSLSFTVPMGCVVLSPTGISSLNISTKILEIKDNYKLSLDITNENIMTFDKYFLNAKKKLDVEIKNKAKIDLEEELEKGEDVLLFEEDDESGFNPVFFAKEKIEDNKMKC